MVLPDFGLLKTRILKGLVLAYSGTKSLYGQVESSGKFLNLDSYGYFQFLFTGSSIIERNPY